MTKKIITSIMLFIFLINTYVYALDYSFSARIINSGTKKYKAVKFTPQIYNNTVENLADLEIFDDNNEPVPYFINSFYESLGEKSILQRPSHRISTLCKRKFNGYKSQGA